MEKELKKRRKKKKKEKKEENNLFFSVLSFSLSLLPQSCSVLMYVGEHWKTLLGSERCTSLDDLIRCRSRCVELRWIRFTQVVRFVQTTQSQVCCNPSHKLAIVTSRHTKNILLNIVDVPTSEFASRRGSAFLFFWLCCSCRVATIDTFAASIFASM